MLKKAFVLCAASLVGLTASAYRVSVGTYVANSGKTVTVPVMLDSAAGLSYASATLTYDPQVLVVTKAEAGSLKSLMAEDFVATDTNGTLTVSIFGSTKENVASGSGAIANVTFAVREGTQGLYSDIAVNDVELGEKTGVKDVTAGTEGVGKTGIVDNSSFQIGESDIASLQEVTYFLEFRGVGQMVTDHGIACGNKRNHTVLLTLSVLLISFRSKSGTYS
jgi:hypothetical protein